MTNLTIQFGNAWRALTVVLMLLNIQVSLGETDALKTEAKEASELKGQQSHIPSEVAEESQTSSVDQVQLYERPQALSKLQVKYPKAAQRSREEGWVDLHFMVGVDGEPYEIVVTDQTGNKRFVEAAVTALKNAVYRPASLRGVPIDARASMRVRFEQFQSPKYASNLFYSRYKRFNKTIRNNEMKKAAKLMKKLRSTKIKNLYEDAFLNLAKFHYAHETGEPASATLKYLKRALSGQSQEKYLPLDAFLESLELMFQLQVNSNDFRGAELTYQRFGEFENGVAIQERYKGVIEKLSDVKNSDTGYAVSATLEKGGDWYLDLFKKRFALKDIKGKIDEIKLQCSMGYFAFPYLEDKAYAVNESYDDCTVIVIGEPGTSFQFWQK